MLNQPCNPPPASGGCGSSPTDSCMLVPAASNKTTQACIRDCRFQKAKPQLDAPINGDIFQPTGLHANTLRHAAQVTKVHAS